VVSDLVASDLLLLDFETLFGLLAEVEVLGGGILDTFILDTVLPLDELLLDADIIDLNIFYYYTILLYNYFIHGLFIYDFSNYQNTIKIFYTSIIRYSNLSKYKYICPNLSVK
jgi:hypothetical protein